MTKTPTNIAASVRAKLLDLARERGDDFQLLLVRYANERLLYRLTRSAYAQQFVLKGAALFTLWTGHPHRATRDIDLLGFGDPSEDHLRQVFVDVLTLNVKDDGIAFDVDALEVGPIREDQAYGGVRIVTFAKIVSARIRIQIDVGFGDAITPEAITTEYPTLLDFPAPTLRAYPRETVVAEKFEAMVQLGLANSRMKDFYDLIVLSNMFAFDGETLVAAIAATFDRRGTPLPKGQPVALSSEFANDATKNTQWIAFLRKSGISDADDLATVVARIAAFAKRPLAAAGRAETFFAHWTPGGSWKITP